MFLCLFIFLTDTHPGNTPSRRRMRERMIAMIGVRVVVGAALRVSSV